MPKIIDPIQSLSSEMVGHSHGNGDILYTNYRDNDPDAIDRLEVWVMKCLIPGTDAEVKLVYLCAINDVGSFQHVWLNYDASDKTVREVANDLWEHRMHYLAEAKGVL